MLLSADTSSTNILESELADARQDQPNRDIFSIKKEWTLYWVDSLNSIPIRSLFTQPILLEENLNESRIIFESNHHLFHMNDTIDSQLYDIIKDRAYSGWYEIRKEETKWDDNNNILIWLEWVQRYYEL